MPWAGKECLILANTTASDLPPTKDDHSGKKGLPVPAEEESVRLVKMEYISDDEAKGSDGKWVSK